MGEVYIKKEDVNKWIGKYFPNKDLISIDDLIGVIEDLDSEVESLKIKVDDLETYEYAKMMGYDDIDKAYANSIDK